MTPSEKLVEHDEFCRRFKARMIERAGETFDDGSSIADYADEIAPSYFEEERGPMTETPEDCADADMSYWGED
jgi:hypothetical protein